MSRMAKLVAALFATLVLGFGAGEWFGPSEAVAVGVCPYAICYGSYGAYWCSASAAPAWCDVDGPSCVTKDCAEPCDPGEPGCDPD